MGKITEYSRQRLASQAVGIPQADQSGQIMAEGIQKGIQGIATIVGEREKAQKDLDKTIALGEFGVKAAEVSEQTHRQYRQEPLKAPEVIRENTSKLIEEMAAGMDPATGSAFRNDATTAMLTQQKQHIARAYDQDTKNITGKIQSLYIESALMGEGISKPEGLAALRKRFDIINQKASLWMDPGTVSAMDNTYWPQAVKGSIDARAITEPHALLRDLVRDKSPYAKENGGALSSTQMKNAVTLAKQQAAVMQVTNSVKYLSTATGEISEMSDALDAGKIGLPEINRRLEWAETRVGLKDETGAEIVDPEFVVGLKNLQNRALMFSEELSPGARKEVIKENLATLKSEWTSYVTGEDQKRNKVTVDDYKKVMSLYNKALALRQAGVLDEKAFQDYKTVMDHRTKGQISKRVSAATFTDAIQNAPKTNWFTPKKDIFTQGFNRIDRDIEKLDVSPDRKFALKTEYMAAFARSVEGLSKEQKDMIEKDDNKALALVEELWSGNTKSGTAGIKSTLYGKPGYRVVNGQTYQYVIGEDGKQKLTVSPDLQKALLNQ